MYICVWVCVKGCTPTDVAFIIIAMRERRRTTLRVNLRHSIMETQPLQLTSPKYTCVYTYIPSSLSALTPTSPPLSASVLGRRVLPSPSRDRSWSFQPRLCKRLQRRLWFDYIAGPPNHVRLNVLLLLTAAI